MTAEQLHAAIRAAYPGANPLTDYIVQDDSDGRGPYLAVWNLTGPLPEGVMMGNNPISRWEELSLKHIAKGAELVDGLTANARLADEVMAAIDAAADGARIAGGALTKEDALEMMLLWQAMAAWIATPIGEGMRTPIAIISRYA